VNPETGIKSVGAPASVINTRMEQGIAIVNKIPARVTKAGTLL